MTNFFSCNIEKLSIYVFLLLEQLFNSESWIYKKLRRFLDMLNLLFLLGVSGVSCRLYLHYVIGTCVCLREVPSLEIAWRLNLNLIEMTEGHWNEDTILANFREGLHK